MDIDVHGADELGTRLGRLADVMEYLGGSAYAKQALRKAGNKVTKAAKARVTPRSTVLRPAIKTRIQVKPDELTFGELGVNYGKEKKAHHAHLVENGHRNFNQYGGPFGKTPAHPFWRPAMKAEKQQMLGAMTDVVVRELKKQWKG